MDRGRGVIAPGSDRESDQSVEAGRGEGGERHEDPESQRHLGDEGQAGNPQLDAVPPLGNT